MRSWESNRTDSLSSRANERMGNEKGIEVGKEALSNKERLPVAIESAILIRICQHKNKTAKWMHRIMPS